MKKHGLAVLVALTVVVLAFSTSQDAAARSQYKKEFAKKYAGDEASDSFRQMVKKSNCSVCHNSNILDQKGKASKKNRNAYGQDLAKLLKKNEKDEQKINAALDTVGNQKNSNGITYAELFKSGKLPDNPKP